MSTAGHHFCFGSASSFFLELFLQSSPVAYWTPTNLEGSSFSVISFLFFHIVHEVLKARMPMWFAIAFPSGPHFVRTLHHDLSMLGGPTWHGSYRLWSMRSFWLVFCDCDFLSVFPPWRRIRGLCKLSDGRDWLWGKLGLALWAGPCSANLSSNFLLMDGAVLPLCSLAWGSPVLESGILYARAISSVLGLMITSSKRTYVNMLHLPGTLLPGPLTSQQAPAEARLHLRLPNTHRLV